MTVGLSGEEIKQLREIVIESQEKPVCCYDYVDGGKYFVKQLLSGFARIIIRRENQGILSLSEGRFKEGTQTDFGRFLNMMDGNPYYNNYMSYTGWFPDGGKNGQGISSFDGTIYAGEWKSSVGFPNDGLDLIFSGNLREYKITSLEFRY